MPWYRFRGLSISPNATGPLRSLHIRSTTRLQDSRQTGPPGSHQRTKESTACLASLPRSFSSSCWSSAAASSPRPPTTPASRPERRSRPRRPTAPRRSHRSSSLPMPTDGMASAGAGGSSGSSSSCSSCSSCSRSCGRSSGAGEVAGVGAGAPATDPAAGTATRAPNGQGHGGWESRAHETFDDWHQRAHGGRVVHDGRARLRIVGATRAAEPDRHGLSGHEPLPHPRALGRTRPGALPVLG